MELKVPVLCHKSQLSLDPILSHILITYLVDTGSSS